MTELKMGMSCREYIFKAKEYAYILNLLIFFLNCNQAQGWAFTVLTCLELQVKLTRKHFQIRIILIIFHTCLLCSSNHTVKIISIHQMFFFFLVQIKLNKKKLKWVTHEKISSGLLWITPKKGINMFKYFFLLYLPYIVGSFLVCCVKQITAWDVLTTIYMCDKSLFHWFH